MYKMGKIQTPDWILKGKEKPKKKRNNRRTFKIRRCLECNSDSVSVVLIGEEGKAAMEWQCNKCKWQGKNVKEIEMNEEELLKNFG